MSTNPAICTDCKRPMRPRGVLLKEMPGTLAWGHSGKCKSCAQPNRSTDRNRPAAPAKPTVVPKTLQQTAGPHDVRTAGTISGLNSFLAAREQRLRIQVFKQNAFLATGGHRPPTSAPKTAAQRPLRSAA